MLRRYERGTRALAEVHALQTRITLCIRSFAFANAALRLAGYESELDSVRGVMHEKSLVSPPFPDIFVGRYGRRQMTRPGLMEQAIHSRRNHHSGVASLTA